MNGTTQRRILIGLAITLFFGLAANAMERGKSVSMVFETATGTMQAGTARPDGDVDRANRLTTILTAEERAGLRPFKLNAAGGIDLTNGMVQFGGVASHLGLYTGTGFLDLNTLSIFGTLEAANGDTLNFVASFSGLIDPITATFTFAGGTGRFVDAVGSASGPVTFNPDFTFLISTRGALDY